MDTKDAEKRIAEILKRGPGDQRGLDLKAGDVIGAIDRVELTDKVGLSKLLNDKVGEPVTLLVSSNPAADFDKGLAHLVLTTRTGEVASLTAAPKPDANAPPQTRIEAVLPGGNKLQSLPSRRIYFLAVNHRQSRLKNQALRRAIAHAIDRQGILTKHFREGVPTRHQALTGPYPPRSWACPG